MRSIITQLVELHQTDPEAALALAQELERELPGLADDVAHWPRPSRQVCRECGGDGYLVYVGGPGYYSEDFGNYLPSEKTQVCPACNGRGREEEAA